MKIAFIGFGEAGRAFADSLSARAGAGVVAAFDLRRDAEMRAAAAARGARLCEQVGEAVADADWIFSAVTADQSLAAAEAAAPHLRQGQTLVDINSVSPGRKRDTAALLARTAAGYLDMAVMAPVHPRGHATPTLVAGDAAAAMSADLAALGFSFEVVGPEPGAATAIKMVRSLFVKGLEAITVETLLAAAASGCYERVTASLAASFPGLGWPQNAVYNFERTMKHGARRAAEMRESAATLDALGLTGGLAAEIARVQDAMGALALDDLPQGELADGVARVAALRTAPAAKAAG